MVQVLLDLNYVFHISLLLGDDTLQRAQVILRIVERRGHMLFQTTNLQLQLQERQVLSKSMLISLWSSC